MVILEQPYWACFPATTILHHYGWIQKSGKKYCSFRMSY